jgi:hypothetical protein
MPACYEFEELLLTFHSILANRSFAMASSPYELTLEQQFQMKLMEQSAQQMSREQMQDLLIQAARLLMLKDNAIRDLIKSCQF